MSPDRRSTWLARAIFEQALSHAALHEAAAQPWVTRCRPDAQLLPIELELDVCSGEQPSLLTQFLGYYDLSLSADPMSHTVTV